MNRISALLTLLLSSNTFAAHFSVIEGKYDCPEIRNSMSCARSIEKSLIEKYSFIKRTTEKSLVVELPVKGVKRFNDEELKYSAIEYVEEFGFLILARQYWEGGDYILLDLNSGAQDELAGYPLFSPNGKHLVVVSKDLDSDYNPNTLQIYKVRPELELVFDAKPNRWGPDAVKWRNDATVSFIKTELLDSYDGPFSEDEARRERIGNSPATLKKVGVDWMITLNKSKIQ